MNNFKDFLSEQGILDETLQYLEEAIIQFGGKRQTQFGQVIILAGGAGSGKGFVLKSLIDIQGKVLDVDALKEVTSKVPKIVERVKRETGHDLTQLNLKNPADVQTLHLIMADVLNLPKKRDQALFQSILNAHPERKPNLIFDVTLKDLQKLYDITSQMEALGYKKQDIHIVWVVNDIEIAMEQNRKRSRVVPEEILIGTHKGVSMTMKDILDMGDKLKRYMDGNIFLAFNKAKVDSIQKKSLFGGSYIKMANYIKVKSRGKPATTSFNLPKEIQDKIKDYTPKIKIW